MTVTTSTESWVRARSGAEKITKARVTSRPTAPSRITATRRRRCKRTAMTAAPSSTRVPPRTPARSMGATSDRATGPVRSAPP